MAAQTRADIYRYVDSQDVIHFSNVPTSPEYEIYIHESPPGRAHQLSSRYDTYIAEAAREFALPFSLIKAIIKVESDFDPEAVSDAGARGLMQIMPGTAQTLGIVDSFNPRENILAGARYFRRLLTKFQGDTVLALAAYNAGPNRVDAAKRVPRIKETQKYVRKVMQYYNRYY